jgi:hypothetical protein
MLPGQNALTIKFEKMRFVGNKIHRERERERERE